MYLWVLLAVTLVCGAVRFLTSELKLKKQILFISSLCILFALFVPVFRWLPTAVENIQIQIQLPDMENQADSNAWIAEQGAEAVAETISKNVADKIGIYETDISVKIQLLYEEIDNINIKKIDVYLQNNSDHYLAEDVRKYLREMFGCTIEIHMREDAF